MKLAFTIVSFRQLVSFKSGYYLKGLSQSD